jgi:hypothetical protein
VLRGQHDGSLQLNSRFSRPECQIQATVVNIDGYGLLPNRFVYGLCSYLYLGSARFESRPYWLRVSSGISGNCLTTTIDFQIISVWSSSYHTPVCYFFAAAMVNKAGEQTEQTAVRKSCERYLFRRFHTNEYVVSSDTAVKLARQVDCGLHGWSADALLVFWVVKETRKDWSKILMMGKDKCALVLKPHAMKT